MPYNFVRASQQLLTSSFNMDESDGMALAVRGVSDILQGPNLEQFLIETYGINYTQRDSIWEKYTKGTGGVKCGSN